MRYSMYQLIYTSLNNGLLIINKSYHVSYIFLIIYEIIYVSFIIYVI